MSNVVLKHRLDLGHDVYLSGQDGPEKLVRAEWVWLTRANAIKVGGVEFACSDTHTVAVEGAHKACSTVPSGTKIDTRSGPQAMERTPVAGDVRVLKLTLAGPSHVYSVGGVLTHNYSKGATAPNLT